MIDVGGILLTRWFWASRILTTAIALIFIWKGIIMTAETILFTPAEYLPWLVVIALLVAGLPILVRSRKAFNDLNKDMLRKGEITERMAFGLDYLSAEIGIIIVAIVGAVLAPGIVTEALSAISATPIVPNLALDATIAFVWSFIVAVKRAHTLTDAVDVFRDNVKITKLEQDAKKRTE